MKRICPAAGALLALAAAPGLSVPVAAAEAPVTVSREEAPHISELAPYSLGLSPDGRWLVFGRSSRSVTGDLTMAFLLRDIVSGATSNIATYNYGNLNFGPRPVWSPDSQLLVYYAVVNETLQLRVWDRKSARELPGSVPIDKAGVAEQQKPQWTPDGRFVLCLSNTDPPKRIWEEQEVDNYVARLRAELVGQRPARSGMTLLSTPALALPLQASYGAGSTSASAGPARSVARQVVAFDVKTGKTQVLAQGAEFVQLQVADSGTVALAGVLDARGDFLIYELPLPMVVPRPPMESTLSGPAAGAPVGADGKPLRLYVQSSAAESFQNFNLSPSGRFVAYLLEGSGEVVTVDLSTGAKRNLTSNVAALTPDGPDAELQKIAGRFDLPLYKGKFGTGGDDVPVWTQDGSALLIRRVVAQLSVTVPRRAELWRISVTDGTARRLVQDTTLSIAGWAECGDRSNVNCVAGPEGSLLALVRRLRPADDGNSLTYARIDPMSGVVHVLRSVQTATGNDLLTARKTGDVIALEETAERPPELWYVPAASRSGKARSLGALNPASLVAVGTVQRLQWTSSEGEQLFAALRLPAGLRQGEHVPVILDVYPGRGGLSSSRHFDPGRLSPLHTRGRFALLKPDMPVKFGSGQVCSDFARYATEALDAAIATGRIDGAHAGVMGISYGGYAVNCIVTHTDRFRAAVSEVGPSDLASTHALGGRGEWNVTKSWQWETPDRMIAESPVYHLDKVTTPLLMVAGKTDLNNALQEYEMYFGLLALKRPAALVSYDNAGHGDYARLADFWPRVVAWFQTYLESEKHP